jgi:hypothetical protein
VPVAAATATATGDDDGPLGLGEVGEEEVAVLFVEDQGADGDSDDQVLSGFSGHFFAHSVTASWSFPVVLSREIHEGVFGGVCDEDDRAPVPAVAAVGAPLGDILLAAEGDAAVAAVAGFHVNDGFVNEHGSGKRRRDKATKRRREFTLPSVASSLRRSVAFC